MNSTSQEVSLNNQMPNFGLRFGFKEYSPSYSEVLKNSKLSGEGHSPTIILDTHKNGTILSLVDNNAKIKNIVEENTIKDEVFRIHKVMGSQMETILAIQGKQNHGLEEPKKENDWPKSKPISNKRITNEVGKNEGKEVKVGMLLNQRVQTLQSRVEVREMLEEGIDDYSKLEP